MYEICFVPREVQRPCSMHMPVSGGRFDGFIVVALQDSRLHEQRHLVSIPWTTSVFVYICCAVESDGLACAAL